MSKSLFHFYLSVVFASVCTALFSQPFYTVNPKDVSIVRDSFGVPHIFGKTDADVAYGLAWANAEDAFHVSQDLIYAAKGFMGRAAGVEGAKADFFVHAIGTRKLVDEKFGTDLSPEFKKYLSAFTQGLNDYAAAHPKEVRVKKAFPINEKDVLAAYVVIMSFMSNAADNISNAVGGKYDDKNVVFDKNAMESVGSNAFALAPVKTVDGKTYLCINPHLSMDGQLSFYEAHLCSEEGLNIVGPMFHGSSSLAMGVNEHLGWAMTWNYTKKTDVFKLKMHPRKKLYYEFDGKWEKLEKRPVWLKVKVKGLQVPVRKVTYWSKYGTTVKSDKSKNFYSVRFGANQTIKTAQQLYEMNKAKNYDEYWNAIRNNALALFNIVYADDKNNIFYLSNSEVPDRNLKFDWKGIMPGNTSENLWTKLLPNDSLPHVINPQCGYVYNTNNTPFDATCEGENDNPNRYPRYLVDGRPGNNNRAILLKQGLTSKDKLSFDDLKRIKFDYSISKESPLYQSLLPLFHLDTIKYPEFSKAIKILNEWNLVCDTNSYATTIFGAFVQTLFNKRKYSDEAFVLNFTVSEDEVVECLRKSIHFLREKFGTEFMRWGDVHVNYRAGKILPLNGFPDALSPSYPSPREINGKTYLVPTHGDTYTMFAKFGNNGSESLESLLPTGNSLREDSPHFNDQMELFRDVHLKKMTLNKNEVMKNAVRVYHPGE